jgi:ABC-type antimicrobial peptide transport system permease subunit
MVSAGYLKSAMDSLRSSRWRSLLMILGVIVGVVSVVTTISLGEGVRRQVEEQIEQRGGDLITILPGERVERNVAGEIIGLNLVFRPTHLLFADSDYRAVAKVPGVGVVAPFSQVTGEVKTETGHYPQAQVIATTAGAPAALNQRLAFGGFFGDDPLGNSAVIGRRVAERLFQQNAPIGQALTIGGREFRVHGVFEEFAGGSPLLSGGDYNSAIFISYRVGQEMMGGNLQIYQILARPKNQHDVAGAVAAISQALIEQRGGRGDFTILSQEERLALSSYVVRLLTGLVAGIAAVSLIVGGIGIMNIMLVAVSERTNEIGVRKAVGATNRQILHQFLAEAAVLSFVGGVLGIFFSLLVNFGLRIFTDLQPVITLSVVLGATGAAIAIGIFFGLTPALKAARKNPIDALRYE